MNARHKGSIKISTKDELSLDEFKQISRDRQEIALITAMQSCRADGNECTCGKFGWQSTFEAHQCNARLSAAYQTLLITWSEPC